MVKLNLSEIRNFSKNDLLKELTSLNNNLIRERSKKSTGGVSDNPMLIHGIKKKIAIINTILNEKN